MRAIWITGRAHPLSGTLGHAMGRLRILAFPSGEGTAASGSAGLLKRSSRAAHLTGYSATVFLTNLFLLRCEFGAFLAATRADRWTSQAPLARLN
jgi:hypothetical protein